MARVAVVTLVAVVGASKVHCPGFSEGVCNCADDCSANANLCAWQRPDEVSPKDRPSFPTSNEVL